MQTHYIQKKLYGSKKKKNNLFIFEASTDIAQLFINSKAFLFFILRITNVANKNGETSHPRQRHFPSDPAERIAQLSPRFFLPLDPRRSIFDPIV